MLTSQVASLAHAQWADLLYPNATSSLNVSSSTIEKQPSATKPLATPVSTKTATPLATPSPLS
ncbi:hypothetical protein SDRG_09702 [Saprolegnia diclina VS20]|uniref:Uncharacterized protein n=1 Tax=Saprolegnia diclina (strain VS20) TaxID=1156394 RepID=T0QDA7_SAPDV|nr:hypothetical protein SDRG_09702 [Saprolegnia diclina VS20]EQC32731.1 hypothetical protein SDRG_09702 [Saprolegnia diclina VS20]|eukprot:XP_008613875.1 hypothetical protein SDRG_09702 [Saprolegnia diclina VS20]